MHEIMETLDKMTGYITKYMERKYELLRAFTYSLLQYNIAEKVNNVDECMRVGHSNNRYVM